MSGVICQYSKINYRCKKYHYIKKYVIIKKEVMMDRKLLARENFLKGYNCCQSVVTAFKYDIPQTEQFLLNLASPFGAGFARTRNICGVVSAMGIVYGLLNTQVSSDIKKEKDETYILMQGLAEEFKAINNTIICKELLDMVENVTSTPVSDERTAEYYKERPCLRYVEQGVEILEKFLIDRGLINE